MAKAKKTQYMIKIYRSALFFETDVNCAKRCLKECNASEIRSVMLGEDHAFIVQATPNAMEQKIKPWLKQELTSLSRSLRIELRTTVESGEVQSEWIKSDSQIAKVVMY